MVRSSAKVRPNWICGSGGSIDSGEAGSVLYMLAMVHVSGNFHFYY